MLKMAEKNTLTIEQSEQYEGDDWWSWSVWIDGPETALDEVDFVEYTLHPTFRDPVRKISTRKNGFKLSTSGWGVFPIYARVCNKDSSVVQLKHQLKLYYPDKNATTN
jgi:transcription initiation factor IIF auxiliary subunit